MSVVKKFLLLCLVVIASAEVRGQARSPFTTFGIGEPYGNALTHNQGMAGTGVSQPQFWYLNNQNPALLVFNTLTVFEAGMVGERRTLRSSSSSEKNTGGNMAYLVTAFPIKVTKWTTSLGLMPYTNVDYEYIQTKTLPDGDNTTAEFRESGSGGLTQLYWSNGVRLSREISVGLKATYLFGPIENVYSNELLKTDQVPYIVAVEEKTSVSDFSFGLGFSFSRDSLWGKNYRFSAGAVYNLKTNLDAKRNDKFYRTTVAGDTIDSNELNNVYGQIKIPAALTVGVSLSRGLKWSVSTELSYQNWSNFSSVNNDDNGLQESWRAALGGEITPDPVALGSYLKRLTYRLGVSMEQYPFLANTNTVKDYGINFGLSLPAGRSNLNMAFKVGKRGNKDENILEENYFKVYFGITFNDQWFIKRKFD
ncbi:porin family protein [Ohtaekwangia koreensis]|uniref:Outer membrane protein transport protein (OMPP1/FadL/TodX) n=1 Tax=Ohtaekwangia koreensis TaxID=688867 RepID=A0A1T5II47_9BACT|nr:outer membrane protein transport protein [Ohtaekwangia koreensis]SKC38807.1 Outer membrane protein transport protein (OMPP1/FadL/TodX) [Ohtaekwangia koreensis]